MQEIKGIKYMTKIFLKVLTVFLLIAVSIYYILFFIWAFDTSVAYQEPFKKFYAIVNPFTFGAYALGLAALLYYLLFKNRIMKGIIGTVYILIIFFTGIAFMGMTRGIDVLIYAPHLFFIAGCIGSIYMNRKKISCKQ